MLSKSVYGLLSILIVLALIFIFFVVMANVMSMLVAFRASVGSLNESWLHIRARTAELLFSHGREKDIKEMQDLISAFENDLRNIFSFSLISTVTKTQKEFGENINKLREKWALIRSKLENVLTLIGGMSSFLSDDEILSVGNFERYISDPDSLQFFQLVTAEIHWISTDTKTFDRDLIVLLGLIDYYSEQQIRAFQVLYYFFGAATLMAIASLVVIGVDIAKGKAREDKIRSLTQSLIKAQENERKRIALELHDSIAQELSLARIACESFLKDRAEMDQDEKRRISELSQMIGRSIKAVRDLSYEMLPAYLHHFGLAHTLSQFCQDFSSRNSLKVQFSSAGLEGISLDFDTEINLYRLVQEALNNIWKHAEADRAVVKLVAAYQSIILRVTDDGRGFNVKRRLDKAIAEHRMGIRGMEERVRLLKGKMKLQSKPGKGTKIAIEVPLIIERDE